MTLKKVQIRQATIEDLDTLVPLFDAYRQFYRHPSDLAGARQFLRERFQHIQSVLFLAFYDDAAIGFTQLYPSFSSGAMRRIFVLNDLFVAPESRRNGAAAALLSAAADYARPLGAVRLVLSTEVTNLTAQSLYERQGWQRDTDFYTYQFPL